MTIVYSCLCFVSISRGLMTKPVGFLRVPPLKFVEQIVWFFSFLISLLFGLFFSVYICVWFYLLESNYNNAYFSRTSFVNFLKVNIVLSYLIKWPWYWSVTWLFGWGILIISHNSATFSVHRPCACGSGNNGFCSISSNSDSNSNSNAEFPMPRFTNDHFRLHLCSFNGCTLIQLKK